uniref:C2H2-type domain-containing protein n=2 Tax=Clastoptera arizonana TaxID=38151 RepID=A0A1B6C650_9HEMI
MSCNRASSFPTVATVIGLNPQTLGNSGTFVATIAVDPNSIMDKSYQNSDFEEIKADDPITQALVDNINGNLPLKKEPEIFRCELCNISVSKKVVLDAHLIGIKHAKKVKSLELIKEINSSGMLTPSVSQPKTEEWRCNICNISVNSSHQLHAHIQGTKHKAKANSSESNMTYVPAEKVGFSSSGLE